MQIAAISALGTTWAPAAAVPASTSVAMASTSGTMMSGLISSNNACNSAAFAISNARYSCATCWAGAQHASQRRTPTRPVAWLDGHFLAQLTSAQKQHAGGVLAQRCAQRAVGCASCGGDGGSLGGCAGEEVEVTAVFTAFSVIPTFCHAAMISPMRGSDSATCAAERVIQYWAKCGSPYHFIRVQAARPTPLQRGGLG